MNSKHICKRIWNQRVACAQRLRDQSHTNVLFLCAPLGGLGSATITFIGIPPTTWRKKLFQKSMQDIKRNYIIHTLRKKERKAVVIISILNYTVWKKKKKNKKQILNKMEKSPVHDKKFPPCILTQEGRFLGWKT